MAEATEHSREARAPHGAASPLGRTLLNWAATTDHKVIGRLYMVTAFCFSSWTACRPS